MNELALFAGAGGGILGGKLLGWRTVCAVERDPYAASVLVARQNDGVLAPFPIWDDVCTFDGKPWRGLVDVVSGGFPCQDISVAGKGAGITGSRSGLWSEMARIVGEVRPRYVFVENSPALVTRGLGVVLSDLAALGYDCKWRVLGADDCGAPHKRERVWIVAADSSRDGFRYRSYDGRATTYTDKNGLPRRKTENGSASMGLARLVKIWPTPRAFMHKDSCVDRGKGNLGEAVGGALNPTWVEWLMGWPLEWTDLKPLETDKFQSWLQQHGQS